MKQNSTVREAIKNANLKHWEIADRLGISENTLVRWLRVPLPIDKHERIMKAIQELSKEG